MDCIGMNNVHKNEFERVVRKSPVKSTVNAISCIQRVYAFLHIAPFYTSPTPSRLNCRVASRRQCVLGLTVDRVLMVPLSDILGESVGDPDDLRLSTLPVLVALLIFSNESSSSSSSDRLCCSCIRIWSSMSPITWKLGSTMKSIKPIIRN